MPPPLPNSSVRALGRACWYCVRQLLGSRPFNYGYYYARQLWHAPLQRNGCSLFEAYSLLEAICSAPIVDARTPLPIEQEPEAPVSNEVPTMSRRRAHRHRPDRREDTLTADLVDIGLMFVDVFGRHRGETYFRATVIEPAVYRRVLLGPCRTPLLRDGSEDTVSS